MISLALSCCPVPKCPMHQLLIRNGIYPLTSTCLIAGKLLPDTCKIDECWVLMALLWELPSTHIGCTHGLATVESDHNVDKGKGMKVRPAIMEPGILVVLSVWKGFAVSPESGLKYHDEQLVYLAWSEGLITATQRNTVFSVIWYFNLSLSFKFWVCMYTFKFCRFIIYAHKLFFTKLRNYGVILTSCILLTDQ